MGDGHTACVSTAADFGPPQLWTCSVAELFDRLDVLHVLLAENADRWSVSSGGEVVERILEERVALRDECAAVERELRVRTGGQGIVGEAGAAAHARRRAEACHAAAALHADAAQMHERAAAVHAAAQRPEQADKERALARTSVLRQRQALARAQSFTHPEATSPAGEPGTSDLHGAR
jgi:hypothetical protein